MKNHDMIWPVSVLLAFVWYYFTSHISFDFHIFCYRIILLSHHFDNFRGKYVTRYSKEYRLQPVMIKDCCPGFTGVECDKGNKSCTHFLHFVVRNALFAHICLSMPELLTCGSV